MADRVYYDPNTNQIEHPNGDKSANGLHHDRQPANAPKRLDDAILRQAKNRQEREVFQEQLDRNKPSQHP